MFIQKINFFSSLTYSIKIKKIKKTEIQAVIWKINVEIAQKVDIGDILVILESMKMEIPVESKYKGVVKENLTKEGDNVNEDQEIIILE